LRASLAVRLVMGAPPEESVRDCVRHVNRVHCLSNSELAAM